MGNIGQIFNHGISTLQYWWRYGDAFSVNSEVLQSQKGVLHIGLKGQIDLKNPSNVSRPPWKTAVTINEALFWTYTHQSTWWRCAVRNLFSLLASLTAWNPGGKAWTNQPDYQTPRAPGPPNPTSLPPSTWVKGPFFSMPADCRRKEKRAGGRGLGGL